MFTEHYYIPGTVLATKDTKATRIWFPALKEGGDISESEIIGSHDKHQHRGRCWVL